MAAKNRKPASPGLLSYSPYDEEIGAHGLTATIPGYPDWLVDVELADQDGTFVVRSVRVQPRHPSRRSTDGTTLGPTPDGGITALLLRAVPLSHFAQLLTTQADAGVGIGDLIRFLHGRRHLQELRKSPRPGRRGRADDFYARWAAEYVRACREVSNPNAVLASKHGFSPATIREYVAEARQRGLLTPGIRGKAGGELTDLAVELLQGEAEQ